MPLLRCGESSELGLVWFRALRPRYTYDPANFNLLLHTRVLNECSPLQHGDKCIRIAEVLPFFPASRCMLQPPQFHVRGLGLTSFDLH